MTWPRAWARPTACCSPARSPPSPTASSHGGTPGLPDGEGGSTANQSLLLQPILAAGGSPGVLTSEASSSWESPAGSAHAWSSRFVQQVLQEDVDAGLVRLFDEHGQSRPVELVLAKGSALHVARPVAVAETAGGADDPEAIIRLRQNGKQELDLLFYEVDDLAGAIDSLAPGDEGYDAASLARACRTGDGGIWIDGPGFGEVDQASILDVDAGDLVAMRLSTETDQFFAFADANEQVEGKPVTQLWNYGPDTWGWEDMKGGGDLDFNDLVVQIDVISASCTGLVA
ncbi:DUF4114 domain-containing protein [Geminicoccus roseus]|uniref:DUF4114 domain-containing protein n=1 Tax=Geminicoccus roseus TaxID=404900 RepID=UPI0004114092|nr:DUF4114 domain-containing protein [Geminicoccus roseus]